LFITSLFGETAACTELDDEQHAKRRRSYQSTYSPVLPSSSRHPSRIFLCHRIRKAKQEKKKKDKLIGKLKRIKNNFAGEKKELFVF
jgi:hypothetical protein